LDISVSVLISGVDALWRTTGFLTGTGMGVFLISFYFLRLSLSLFASFETSILFCILYSEAKRGLADAFLDDLWVFCFSNNFSGVKSITLRFFTLRL
jgi:hypothetical protein